MDRKLVEIEEEEEKTLAPDFWDDPKKAEQQLKLIKDKKVTKIKIEHFVPAFEEGMLQQEKTINTNSQTNSLQPASGKGSPSRKGGIGCRLPDIGYQGGLSANAGYLGRIPLGG